jgi:dTDP-glucose 4,6-dehydratase
MVETIRRGTEWALELAKQSHSRLLFLSSGAVYGPRTALSREDDLGQLDLDSPIHAYSVGKRQAEALCTDATMRGDVAVVIGRLFSFVGPSMPLGGPMAAGSFLAAALAGDEISITGDGRAERSFLYAGDLPEWCLTLATRGTPGVPYNVGSAERVSIADLARQIATLATPPAVVRIEQVPALSPPPVYVPDLSRSATLALAPRTSLAEALKHSFSWARETFGGS